jgi:hypothetical protein
MGSSNQSGEKMNTTLLSSEQSEESIKYVCGMDMGSQSWCGCIMKPKKEMVVKPITFATSLDGWRKLLEHLSQLEASPDQITIGMEATSRYHENLYEELRRRGYQMRLLHPGQTHHFHQQQGLRARARSARCSDHCPCAAESERKGRATFPMTRSPRTEKWSVCIRSPSEEVARYQNQIQALVVVLFASILSGRGSTVLAHSPGGTEPPTHTPRRWGRREWRRYIGSCEQFLRLISAIPPPRN